MAGSGTAHLRPDGQALLRAEHMTVEFPLGRSGLKVHAVSDVSLDMTGVHAFNQRVYAFARAIPRGETRTYGEVAASLRLSGAVHSVAQAIARNPFVIIVPCHRVLEAGSYADKISPNGGVISKRRLLSLEGAGSPSSKTLFDVLLPVAPSRPQN